MKTGFSSISITLILMLNSVVAYGGDAAITWREDFSQISTNLIPQHWQVKTRLGTPKTAFKVERQATGSTLVINAVKSTGTLMTMPQGVDLHKTPILRWCWRAINLPPKADGRAGGKDDQAIAIYIGMSAGIFGKNTIAYRWETETPRHSSAKTSYGFGSIKVNWFCLRNKNDKLGIWYIEERNIAHDFKRIYGRIPTKFALSIAANSQYTQSSTRAEIKWLEFVAENKDNDQNRVAVGTSHDQQIKHNLQE